MNENRFLNDYEYNDAFTLYNEYNINSSGILIKNNNEYYLNNKISNSLIISEEDIKDNILYSLLKSIIASEESGLVVDSDGSLYKKLSKSFINNGYLVYAFDFNNLDYGDSFNPLLFPYHLYLNNNINDTIKILYNIGYILFNRENKYINIFIAECLYLFNKGSSDTINLYSIKNINMTLLRDSRLESEISKLRRTNLIYSYLNDYLLCENTIKENIIMYIDNCLNSILNINNINKLIVNNSFKYKDYINNKSIVFLIGNNNLSNKLIPMFILELYKSIFIFNSDNKYSFVLDNFDRYESISNINELFIYSRTKNIRYYIRINNLSILRNKYNNEDYELFKINMDSNIYVYSKDSYTLNYLEDLTSKLISSDKLRLFKDNKCLIINKRYYPVKTNLVSYIDSPFYDMDDINTLSKKNDIDYKVFDYGEIKVVAGLIKYGDKYLIAKRTTGNPEVIGKWEFPGGHIEENESSQDALEREMMEEFSIKVITNKHLTNLTYRYPGKVVNLDFYDASVISDEIILHNDHNEYRLVSFKEIDNYDLAPADRELYNSIKDNYEENK